MSACPTQSNSSLRERRLSGARASKSFAIVACSWKIVVLHACSSARRSASGDFGDFGDLIDASSRMRTGADSGVDGLDQPSSAWTGISIISAAIVLLVVCVVQYLRGASDGASASTVEVGFERNVCLGRQDFGSG
eukprot:1258410-Pleurochrysis_carterae.AAC.3